MRQGNTRVFRVSDLLENGFPKETLIREFVRVNQEAWPPPFPQKYLWTEEKVRKQFDRCPTLQYAAFAGKEIAGTLSMFHVNESRVKTCSSWDDITSQGTFLNHDADSDSAFGADLSVGQKFQSKGVSGKLILSGLSFCTVLSNKKGVFLGSRIPHFHKKSGRISVEDYVLGKNRDGKTMDPEIRIYQNNGFRVVRIVPGYMEDPDSLNYGVLMFWENPLYKLTQGSDDTVSTVAEMIETLYFG